MGSIVNTHTAADAFFEAIAQAGITHCFVNLGSDHPGMIEAMVKGQRQSPGKFPRIITCPHEVLFSPRIISALLPIQCQCARRLT